MRPSIYPRLRALSASALPLCASSVVALTLVACTVAGPSMVAGSNAKDSGIGSAKDTSVGSNDSWSGSDDTGDTVDDTTGTTTTTPTTQPTPPSSVPDAGPPPMSDAGPRDGSADARPPTPPADAGPIDQHLALIGTWHLTALTTENLSTFRQFSPDGVYAETLEGASRVGRFRNGDRENHFVIEVHPLGQATVTSKEYCTYAMTATKAQMSVICRAIGYSSNASVAITDAQPPVWTLD